jgi:alpha/beta hydrolase fold
MKILRAIGVLVFALPPIATAAADYPAPKQSEWIARDFRFHTGEAMSELKLHYTTIGEPTGSPVVVLHGSGGSAASMLASTFAGELFGPGQPLDATRYYIIIPDALGHGQSAKPSDGLKTKFPHYDYADMVDAQHRLLCDGLGIHHRDCQMRCHPDLKLCGYSHQATGLVRDKDRKSYWISPSTDFDQNRLVLEYRGSSRRPGQPQCPCFPRDRAATASRRNARSKRTTASRASRSRARSVRVRALFGAEACSDRESHCALDGRGSHRSVRVCECDGPRRIISSQSTALVNKGWPKWVL